jgi:hypothetical protein
VQAPIDGALPATIVVPRARRKHDRTKYPWKEQRRRRKLVQVTVVSTVGLLFLIGVLYMAIVNARPPAPEGDSLAPSPRATRFSLAKNAHRRIRCAPPDHVITRSGWA